MGINGCDAITVKRDLCTTANRANGLTADGQKISHGFCETGLEQGMLAAGVAMPLVSQRGLIYSKWQSFSQNPSWARFGNSCKDGWGRAWQTITHPGNYADLEFLNSKIGKIEGIMTKNMPTMPKFTGTNASQLEGLFQRLVTAKNPGEYASIVKQNRGLYTKLSNIMRRGDAANWTKLTQMAKYNEIYGSVLQEMQTSRTTIMNGGTLARGHIATVHKSLANARLLENQWIRAIGKSGKQGAGLVAKGCAYMSKGVKTAMAASKWVRGASRTMGKAGGWIAAALTLVTAGIDCYAAWQVGKQTGNEWSCLGRQVVKSAGRAVCELGAAWGGAWAGAAIGQACLPFLPGVGAVIGGIIGGFVGFFAGSKVADNVPGLDKSVAEEEMQKQQEQQKQMLCKAVDEGNWQAVMQYVEANKMPKVQVNEKGEPILDAEGNPQPVLDANGNQVFEYAQISDKPEEQKAFEAEIDRLQTWVEEKMLAAYQAEQAAQQAQAQGQAPTSQNINNIGYGNGVLAPDYQSVGSGYGPNGADNNGYVMNNSVYGSASTTGDYASIYDLKYGGYSTQPSQYNLGWSTNYDNLAYNFDNGKYDFMNMNNPFMMNYNYNNNIFTTKYGPQAA